MAKYGIEKEIAKYGRIYVQVIEEKNGKAKIAYATADEHIEHWVDMGELVYADIGELTERALNADSPEELRELIDG